MDVQIKQALEGKSENYLLPFLWMVNGDTQNLEERVETIYKSGARALCLESRTHDFFCEDAWWEDVEIILKACKERDMKVWILDDKHFPTGYANKLATKKYPHLRRWQLVEHHVDVLGPAKEVSFLLHPGFKEDELLGVYMYERTGNQEEICGKPICLTHQVEGDFLYLDVPQGCYRIFFYYKSRKGMLEKHADYINLIDEAAVKVQIEAVYEPHFEHFKEYFGSTIAGFFSDEPSLGNQFFNATRPVPPWKDRTLGLPGQALPWSDELLARLSDGGKDGLEYLATLWFDHKEMGQTARYEFMDMVSSLYQKNFSFQLGNWCRDHQVMYIGHIIEDMNAHARLSCSNGHFFRSLNGQDMSGIDIVLHQVLPGFANYDSSTISSGGVVSPEFYHYVLANMGASLAQLNPNMKRRAMCEVFGAYGWAESAPMMKWLMDFLLLRGINHFVPHAFSPIYPNLDCPPHFGGNGNDPQFDGFCKLMNYTNQVSHVMIGAKSTAKVAILYHGEAEWMNTKDCMLMQKPAKKLMDAHIAFEYLPFDYIDEFGQEIDHQLVMNDIAFRCVLVPYAKKLPQHFINRFAQLEQAGIAVRMVCNHGDKTETGMKIILLDELETWMKEQQLVEIAVEPKAPLLRISHVKRGTTDIYMLFNEGFEDLEMTEVTIPSSGTYLEADFLNGVYHKEHTDNGKYSCKLRAYESKVLIFGEFEDMEFAPKVSWEESTQALKWQVSLKEEGVEEEYRSYQTMESSFENITRKNPNFSGKMKYETSLHVEEGDSNMAIDLGEVGEVAQVFVNGVDCGIKIAPPYFYDISEMIKCGENTLEVVVANTLVHRLQDNFSAFLTIPASGLMGPVKIYQ